MSKSLASSLSPGTFSSVLLYLLRGPHDSVIRSLPSEGSKVSITSFWSLAIQKELNLRLPDKSRPEHISYRGQYDRIRAIDASTNRFFIQKESLRYLAKILLLDLGYPVYELHKTLNIGQKLRETLKIEYQELLTLVLHQGSTKIFHSLVHTNYETKRTFFVYHNDIYDVPPLHNFIYLLSWIKEKALSLEEANTDIEICLKHFNWDVKDLPQLRYVLKMKDYDPEDFLVDILDNQSSLEMFKALEGILSDEMWLKILPGILDLEASSSHNPSPETLEIYRYYLRSKGHLLSKGSLGIPGYIYQEEYRNILHEEGKFELLNLMEQIVWERDYPGVQDNLEILLQRDYGGSLELCFQENKEFLESYLEDRENIGVYWAAFYPILPDDLISKILEKGPVVSECPEDSLIFYRIAQEAKPEFQRKAQEIMDRLSVADRLEVAKYYESTKRNGPTKRLREEETEPERVEKKPRVR